MLFMIRRIDERIDETVGLPTVLVAVILGRGRRVQR